MKKLIATLFALMLIAAVMPAAWAAKGSGSLGIDVEDDNDDNDDNDGAEVEVELEASTDDSSDDSVDDSSDDGSDDSAEVETEVETERDGSRNRTRTEYKDGALRIRTEFREGGLRIREEFRASGFANLSVEERKELLASLQERRQKLVEDRKEAMLEIRQEIRQDTARIKELRSEYSGEREQFMKARSKLKVECSDATSTECKRAKQELNTEAKDFMGNAAEQMLRIIETMKVRVEANENIDNETAAAVIAQLEARSDAISAAQAKIDALGNSTDLNATQSAAAELRTAWTEARVTIRLTEGLLTHARYAEFVGNLELMETRFTEARSKLVAEGKNVTQLDADLAAFSAKIDAATAGYVAAQESYIAAMANAKTEADANKLLKDTRDQLKENQQELQDARHDLRAIIKDIRALSTDVLRETTAKVQADAQQTSSVETEVEVESEVEA